MDPLVPPLKLPLQPPAVSAECLESVRLAFPGAALQEIATRRFRSITGKMRFDSGLTSLISDPATGLRILLDHAKLEARMLSAPTLPAMPGMPAMPAIPIPPVPSLSAATQVLNLGKSMVEGLEAEGMRYIFAALDPLKPPSIASWEIWTSVKFQLPILTRIVGSFGERVNLCKCSEVHPPEALFQIPAGYRVIPPEVPPLPHVPGPSAMPSAPALPSAPTIPSLPAMPSAPALPSAPTISSLPAMPSAPALPSTPAIPSLPAMPNAPSLPALPTIPKPGLKNS